MLLFKLKYILCLILIKFKLTNNQEIENNPQVTEIQEEIDYNDDHNETLLIKNTTIIPTTYKTTKINFNDDDDDNFKPNILIENEKIKSIYKNSDYSLTIPSSLNSDLNIINKGIVTFPTNNNQPTKTSNNIYHVDSQYRINSLNENTNLNNDNGYLTIELPSSSVKQQSSPYYFTPNNNNAFKNHPTINPYYQLPILQQANNNDDVNDVPVVHYQQHYELITPEYYQQNNQLPQYDNQQHYLHQQQQQHHHHDQADINNDDKPTEMLFVSSHRETSLTKTRKFPYKYYQPNDDTEINFIKEGHAFVPRDRQVSPWQKLIHLAWAVLPLGLLFAALKSPARINRNSTQPNIMLSKLRDGEDLPVEHKKKIDEICDDIKLCETIVHGSDKKSELIYNILWNFATKSTNEEARKNGLEEIFQAVKKKNCNIITC